MRAGRPTARRGEVYLADPDPTVGHEQGGRRPFLVISIDTMNRSPAELVIAVPLTTTDRESKLHVRLDPPEGGVSRVSFVMPEMVRVLSAARLQQRLGSVSGGAVDEAARRVGILAGLGRSR